MVRIPSHWGMFFGMFYHIGFGEILLKIRPPCGVEYTELINKLAKNIKNTILRDKLRGFKHECCVLSVRSNETGWLVFFSHCGANLLDHFFCFASLAEE